MSDTIRGDRKLAALADNRHRTAIMDWVGNGCPHTICSADNKTRVYNLPDVIDWCNDRGLNFYDKSTTCRESSDTHDELRRQTILNLEQDIRAKVRNNNVAEGIAVLKSDVVHEYSRVLREIKSRCREWLSDCQSSRPDMPVTEKEKQHRQLVELFNSIAESR